MQVKVYELIEYLRENETITVDPFWVLRVVLHDLVEEDVGHRGHAHWGAGMARVGLEGGIDLLCIELAIKFTVYFDALLLCDASKSARRPWCSGDHDGGVFPSNIIMVSRGSIRESFEKLTANNLIVLIAFQSRSV
jgi:hypothetical protein